MEIESLIGETTEYVERSYHEALINALVHRDCLINGSEVHVDMYDDRLEIYSPGGMPDGSNIQERNPLTVPSTRRNPILADVFNRIGYMERKGSGFSKIISGYSMQINYSENKKPIFSSDRYQFTVIMPNLNYNVFQIDTCKNQEGSGILSNVSDKKIGVVAVQNVPHDGTQDGTHDGTRINTNKFLQKNKKLSNVLKQQMKQYGTQVGT